MNFVWDEREVLEFDHMWNEGLSIPDIARAFGRDPDEVAVLTIDRARRGHISKRAGGALGRRMPAND
jgi:hypothetical protein